MSITDTEIIYSIRNKDRNIDKCLEYLYTKNLKKVVRYFSNKGIGEEEVKDMFQDSIIVFYESVLNGKFEPRAKISTFLFSVVNNKYINKLRKTKIETGAQDSLLTEGRYQNLANTGFDEERIKKVQYFMEQLKEDCKQILTLFYYNTYSMKEVAEYMGFKNEQNARNKKAKCLKYLQERILMSRG